MFNDYQLYQLAKLRQQETERTAIDSWKFFATSSLKKVAKKPTVQSNTTGTDCCPGSLA